MPEGFAAVSARPARTTKSIISPGSSLATIGLAIPAVGVATYALDEELTLGLGSQGSMLLLLTFFLSMLTFGTGRTNVLSGWSIWWYLPSACSRFSYPEALRPMKGFQMLAAKSEVQVDNEEVRVTEWRLPPGGATGHHTHGMDYVIVPVVAGEMTIVAPGGERSKAQLAAGKSYFRKAGVQHDVLNETSTEIVFLEIELKP